jgi:dolichyl-diphosphooligosaccharide--protein glycosyltransferase
MTKSLVYNLVRNDLVPADAAMFKEVYRTKYGKVRIFKIMGVDKESKKWVADPKNRDCDVEGGWYCKGQYPPALDTFLKVKKDFVQLEDFNKKDEDTEYQQKYFESMKNIQKNKNKMEEKMRDRRSKNEL